MKRISPHFWYSKSQRNGVIILVLLILSVQALILFLPFDGVADEIDSKELQALQHQIDSLKKAQSTAKFELYPFNPNYISDFKGYQLGLTVAEFDRLFAYRKKGLFVNSAKEFQNVTKVSDSLLAVISPYFKFPEWLRKRSKRNPFKKDSYKKTVRLSTKDINKASKADLQTVAGIGEKRSERIINYRKRIQGFSFKDQLNEVWGLDEALVRDIWNVFEISELPKIEKLNINTATFKEVLRIPYIDYKLCKQIFDYRDLVAEIKSLTELQRIEGFPKNKYDRIVLYLRAD